ncbi:MAG: hypothetical protein KKD73_00540 [Proteobacteria bacterium]|nr:hypothetical protein [Pseudomonadota bacterium]MBU1640983.1 hypothetical protein [Pseudomonadota bacterium]
MKQLIIGCLFVLSLGSCANAEQLNAVEVISASFPDSIEIKRNGNCSIEFCPDNTCEFYEAKKDVSYEELADFFYIYTYFFSDYYTLNEWRNKDEARETARKVLARDAYKQCKGKNDMMTAQCILLKISNGQNIKMYFVRDDENERHLVPIDIAKATVIR